MYTVIRYAAQSRAQASGRQVHSGMREKLNQQRLLGNVLENKRLHIAVFTPVLLSIIRSWHTLSPNQVQNILISSALDTKAWICYVRGIKGERLGARYQMQHVKRIHVLLSSFPYVIIPFDERNETRISYTWS